MVEIQSKGSSISEKKATSINNQEAAALMNHIPTAAGDFVLNVGEESLSHRTKEPREGFDKFTFSAIMTILGGWAVLLIIGAQLSWGNQSTYIASYYYMLGQNVHMEDFYIVQPLIVVTATIFFPMGMQMAINIGAKKVLILGGVISLSLVFLCSFIQSPTAFIYCYGFGFGIGKALMYSAALQAGWSHLQDRIGMVSGLIICGFGFGGFFFGIITNRLCNPDNIAIQKFMIDGEEEQLFPKEVAERVPYMLRTLDLIWTSLFLFAACTVHTYKAPQDLQIMNEVGSEKSIGDRLLSEEQREAMLADDFHRLSDEEQKLKEFEDDSEANLPLKEILKTGKFVGLYCLVVCHMFSGYYISNQFKQYGFMGGIDDKTLTIIGSSGALFNGCFKVFWATLLDYFNFKPIYGMILFIQISMLIWVHWAVSSPFQYAVVICLSFMCDGSMTSMIPVVTQQIYGVKRGPTVYSYVFSSFGVSAMLGTLLVEICQEPIGYHGMLLVCLGFTTVSAIITLFYRFQKISYSELALKVGYETEKIK